MTRRMCLLAAVALGIVLGAAPALAQEHGGGGGGDLFGDLVHIKRLADTGQPILQKRWIEYPQDIQDWGYCPIPVDADGNELPFAPLSCDVDPAYEDRLVEVDYFGRLSGGRTRPRNIRMHFNEAIERIKAAQIVDRDAAGRLTLGTECDTLANGGIDEATCTWRTIDSPQENLALYNRLLRYGHIQTDPLEINLDFHGDPETGTVYFPALTPADRAKFEGPLVALLSSSPTSYAPEPLASDDFAIAASFLGGAADKTGIITMDLLQYMHRILKLTTTTPEAAATLSTLPALIRDCGTDPNAQIPVFHCPIYPAPAGLPAPADERFLDYGVMEYDRTPWFGATVSVIQPAGVDTWVHTGSVVMHDYLSFKNPGRQTGTGLQGYVNASLDAVRAVEFVHNYSVPVDLGWDFATLVPDPSAIALLGLNADRPAPQSAGQTIRFTADATGGVAPLGYKWWLFDGTYWTVLSPWSTSNTVDWTPSVASSAYEIGVWVRNGTSTLDSADAYLAIAYPITSGVRVESIAANPTPPQVVGTSVEFKAIATGGTAPYEYQWWLRDATTWSIVQSWSSSDTFTWTPTVANAAYRVGVWVRSAGSVREEPETDTSYTSIAYPITAPVVVPLKVTGISTGGVLPPQPPATTVQFTATVTGGTPPYQYRWWVFNGTAWTLAVDWSPNATYAWTPLLANPAYRVGVWVRSAGSTQDEPETATSYTSIPFAIAP